MEKKISVIVPVYNVEAYLEECIESIIAQDFEDMEILCIEDASTDRSLEKLVQLAEKYNQVEIIQHPHNKGLSAARNTGIKHAKGKYVMFVDSDDMLVADALKTLYTCAETNCAEIVYFNMEIFYDLNTDCNHKEHKVEELEGMYTGKDFFCQSLKAKTLGCEAWRQFIRKDFLEQKGICFYEGILHEDNLFSFYTMMKADRLYYLKKDLYRYRQRENSIMRTKDKKRAQSMFVVLSEVYVYWKTNVFTKDESACVGKYWEMLYRTYMLYKAYGDDYWLVCGDDIDKEIYKIINKKEQKKWLNVDSLDINHITSFSCVIVYGAGNAAKQVIDYLHEKQIHISDVIVKEIKDNPRHFCGIDVSAVKDYICNKENSVVIIGVTEKYSKGIRDSLRSYGYKNIISLPDAISKLS